MPCTTMPNRRLQAPTFWTTSPRPMHRVMRKGGHLRIYEAVSRILMLDDFHEAVSPSALSFVSKVRSSCTLSRARASPLSWTPTATARRCRLTSTSTGDLLAGTSARRPSAFLNGTVQKKPQNSIEAPRTADLGCRVCHCSLVGPVAGVVLEHIGNRRIVGVRRFNLQVERGCTPGIA